MVLVIYLSACISNIENFKVRDKYQLPIADIGQQKKKRNNINLSENCWTRRVQLMRISIELNNV